MKREAVYVKSTSYGFRASLWQVTHIATGEVVFANALSNYDACEAYGWKFNECNVQEMALVPFQEAS